MLLVAAAGCGAGPAARCRLWLWCPCGPLGPLGVSGLLGVGQALGMRVNCDNSLPNQRHAAGTLLMVLNHGNALKL